jgi:hypothetical protein
MNTPDDPLLERLRRLPGARLDDVTAARTLTRAETAFASAAGTITVARPPRAQWAIPAALALWGAIYSWGATRELGRLFATERTAKPAVAANHRGPAEVGRDAQFMLNAISKVSARTTTTITIVPPRPDTLRATSLSISVPVRSDESSDMDPSMHVVVRDTRNSERTYARGGPRHDRGADGGAIGAQGTSLARAEADHAGATPASSATATGGSLPGPGRALAARAMLD